MLGRWVVVIAFVVAKAAVVQAFSCIEYSAGKCIYWGDRRATMSSFLGTPNTRLPNGTLTWDDNTVNAANEWNAAGAIQFSVSSDGSFRDPCGAQDGRNHLCTNSATLGYNPVYYTSTFCGDNFGDVIELTNNCWDRSNGRMLNAPVFVNANVSWSAYDGAQRFSGGVPVYDIRRVLLHELGHVLGLDHPDTHGQTVAAIMNSRVSNTDRLQADDTAGARAIYASIPSQSGGSLTGTSGCHLGSTDGRADLLPLLLMAVVVFLGRPRRVSRRN